MAAINPLEEEGLLANILASLALSELLQLRRVCQLWNSLFSSHAFWEKWITRHRQHDGDKEAAAAAMAAACRGTTWLVMARKHARSLPFARELVAFDSSSGTWIPLEPLLINSCSQAALAALGGPSCRLVANPDRNGCFALQAAGSQVGLACFLCIPFRKGISEADISKAGELNDFFNFRAFYFMVLNLLTGSHTILPPPLKYGHFFASCGRVWFNISLQALPHHHYRVVVQPETYGHSCPVYMQFYDSRTGSWSPGRSCRNRGDAKIGGVKELEGADILQFSCTNDMVFGYNVVLDEWNRFYGNLSNRNFMNVYKTHPRGVTLLRHRGRVLLASVQFNGSDRLAGLAGFEVWELRPHAKLPRDTGFYNVAADWVEVARTPRHLWEGLYDLPKDLFEVEKDTAFQTEIRLISSGSLFCMTVALLVSTETKYYVPLVYDIDRNWWYHLPPYDGCYDVVGVFGMRPSLAAVV